MFTNMAYGGQQFKYQINMTLQEKDLRQYRAK